MWQQEKIADALGPRANISIIGNPGKPNSTKDKKDKKGKGTKNDKPKDGKKATVNAVTTTTTTTAAAPPGKLVVKPVYLGADGQYVNEQGQNLNVVKHVVSKFNKDIWYCTKCKKNLSTSTEKCKCGEGRPKNLKPVKKSTSKTSKTQNTGQGNNKSKDSKNKGTKKPQGNPGNGKSTEIKKTQPSPGLLKKMFEKNGWLCRTCGWANMDSKATKCQGPKCSGKGTSH